MSTEQNGYKSGSNLEKILRAGYFAFTGELGPPRGTNANEVREKASHYDIISSTRFRLNPWQ